MLRRNFRWTSNSRFCFSLTTVVMVLAIGCVSGCGPGEFPTTKKDQKEPGDITGDVALTCEGEPIDCASWTITVGEGEASVEVSGAKGICGEQTVTAECVAGEWVCTFEAFVEQDEVCDGLDSDCDGIADVDEFVAADLADNESCKGAFVDGELAGVCAGVKLVCGDDGEYLCDFAGLEDYAEVEGFDQANLGRWCDGKDNDCDGEVDEGLFNLLGYDKSQALDDNLFEFGKCPFYEDALGQKSADAGIMLGVCGADVSGAENEEYESALLIRCNGSSLECGFSCGDAEDWGDETCDLDAKLADAGYEEEETLCDGLDNDCDGEVDDVFDVASSGCPYQGVCKGKVEAICKDLDEETEEYEPGWVCVFDSQLLLDPTFEYEELSDCDGEPGCGAESLCDGLDNDCDGLVDEGLRWPQECFSQSADGSASYRCDDEDFPQCALYHPECAESAPPTYDDCPVWASEKVDVDGVNVKVPEVTEDGLPYLPGVCAFDDDGATAVKYSCEGKNVDSDEEDDLSMWQCNFDEVEGYNDTEGNDDAQYCDGMDNNCDGVPDGELKPNGTVVYIKTNKVSPHVPCRSLGACANSWEATCNKDGANPGKWYCEFDSDVIEMVDPNNPDCDPGFSNCLWAESKCDGIDNDCDGLVDELLDGFKVDLDEACAAVIDVGVCDLDALDTVCTDLGGGDKGFACDFSGVAHYAPVEENSPAEHPELCDGRDNDCDGDIDEGIHFFSPSKHEEFSTGCLFKGVCAAGTKAICAPGDPVVEGEASWDCDYSQLGQEFANGSVEVGETLTEVKCDGLDNDCDGQVDEGLSQDLPQAGALNPKLLSGCPQKGICAGVMKWNCDLVDGEPTWSCDPTDVGLSYEPVETRCDGIDNDCDGAADEELSDIGENGADCKVLGVCAEGGVTAACIDQAGEAAWACYYDEVVEYDGLVETSCDGKDNDCDGEIDEELDWESVNACSLLGVCNSPLLDAQCQGEEGWYCKYGLIEEWEAEETLCDQLDNDCDGNVDELSCDICEPCGDANYCTSGVCSAVPGLQGLDKYCSYSMSYCVYTNPYSGECDFKNNNESACADAKTAVLCGNGVWFDKETCTGTQPVCYDGECKTCVPGSKSCDGNNVRVCNGQGTSWTTEKICSGGTVCVGEGACVDNTEFKISTQSLSSTNIDVEPKIVPRPGGGFTVIYTARDFVGGEGSDVLMRQFTSGLTPVGVQETIVNSVVSGVQQNPAVDNIPSETGGFIVVWEDTEAPVESPDGTDIVAQIFSDAGQKLGDRFAVNTATVGDQTLPTVAAFSNGTFIVAWEDDANKAEDPEILAQAYKADGSKFGDVIQLNTYVPGEQRYPVLARLPTVGYVSAWSSAGQVNNLDVFYQRLDKNFVKTGAEMQCNVETNSLQNRPSVYGFDGVKAGAFAMTWESFGQDGSSMGVFMNTFDKNGNRIFDEDVLVNKLIKTGSQRDPALAILDDNQFVIAWESQTLPGDSELEGIAAKVYSAAGTELEASEHLVNEETAGRQTNADIAPVPGGGYVVVWFSQPGAGQYHVQGRLFKVQ